MKTFIITFSLLFSICGFSQTKFKTLKESSEIAVKANKQILLVHINSSELKSEVQKKLSSLTNTFVIHYVDVSDNSGLTEDQQLLNKRLEGVYNREKIYPTLHVLGKYAENKGVSYSKSSDQSLDEFLKSLTAR